MENLDYSAGMTARPFLYIESKKTAKYMLEGFSKEALKRVAVTENIFQVPSEERADQLLNSIYRRLSSLDMFLIEKITTADILTSKALVMFAIMKTDRLFFEFMYEVFREKLILGDHILKDRDMNVFFDNKKTQSGIIAKWTESTIKKIKSSYIRILFEVGLLINNADDRKITPILIDYRIGNYLRENCMAAYMDSVTGEC